jgi:predicted NBD/HSP70 family sugar kinase
VDDLLTPEEMATLVADQLAQWRTGALAGHMIVGVGIAVPGLVRASDGLVRNAPHLLWRDVALRDLVAQATGLPVVVGNDASMGVVAERLFGAARGVDDVIYLNGGAGGIGGGLVVHGTPVGGASGYAGEFGHNRPGIASTADRKAEEGVLEEEVSRARLLSAVHLRSADEPTLAAALAASTDAGVRDEIARQRRILATALANAVNVLNPSVVVLGGYLAALVADDLEGLRDAVSAQAMPSTCDDLDIRIAVLAEDRLLIGAAEAAFADLLRDPLTPLAP